MNSSYTPPPDPKTTGTMPGLGPILFTDTMVQPGADSTTSPADSLYTSTPPPSSPLETAPPSETSGSLPALGPILDPTATMHPAMVPTGSTQISGKPPGASPPEPTGVSSIVSNDHPAAIATDQGSMTQSMPPTGNSPDTLPTTVTTTHAQDHQNVTSPTASHDASNTAYLQTGTVSAIPSQSAPSISGASTHGARRTATLAGGIVGGILGGIVLVILLYLFIRHRRKRSSNALMVDPNGIQRLPSDEKPDLTVPAQVTTHSQPAVAV